MSEQEATKIKELLIKNNFKFKLFVHKAVFTSIEAANERGLDLKQGVKALIFKGEKFIMALCPSDKKVNTKKLSRLIGAKNLKLVSPEEVFKITNCKVGSVHPFGFLHGLDTYLDEGILENEIVDFNIGLHEESVSMRSVDLVKVIKPKILSFSK